MSNNGNNNNNNGFLAHNVHNLTNNNFSTGEPNQLADLLAVFQQQQQQQQQQHHQQQQINTADNNSLFASSLEPAPINPLGLLQPYTSPQDANLTSQQQQQQQFSQTLADMGSTLANLQPASAMRGGPSSARRPSTVFGRGMTERQQFLIFVKILLKYVDRTNNPQLRRTAKAVVAECTRRNRMGDAEYTPLQEAVERQLRRSLGEVHWARAKQCFDTYLARQNIRTVQATTIQAV